MGSAFAKISLDSKELDFGMSSSKGKFESFVGGLEGRAKSAGSTIGKALAAGVVAAGMAAGAAATKGLMSFKDLESAASSAASKSVDVNGKSVEQIKAQYDDLQKHVIDVSRQLGQATVFDPKDVAEAYDALAGAGQNVAKIGKNELLPFLNLASTDMQFGLGNTTELVMGVMNSFGLQMKDSGQIADYLTKAVNGTSANLSDFQYALKQSGSTAAALKLPMNEYLAIIGDLKDRNIQGEMSGEALKTAMLALTTPTKIQTEALEALGLSVSDVDPRTHKFTDTLKLLKDRGADVGDFAKIFTDSSGAIMYGAAQDIEKIRELSGSIKDSGGLAQTMADLIMGSDKLVGAFEQAKGSTADLFVALGQYLEPAAVKLLNAWTELVPKIEELGEAVGKGDWKRVGQMISSGVKAGLKELSKAGDWAWQQIQPGINALKNKIQPALEKAFAISGAYTGLKLMVSGFGLMIPAVSSVAAVISGPLVRALETSRLAFVSTWAAAIGPIAGVVAGAALVAAGLGAIGYALNPEKFTTFNKVASDAFAGISDVVSDCWSLIQQGDFSGVAARLRQAFGDAKDYVLELDWGALGSDIVGMIADGAKAIIKSVLDLGGWIHDKLTDWIKGGGPRQLGQSIADTISGGLSWFFLNDDWNKDAGKAIEGALKTAWEWVQIGWDIAVGIAEGIIDKIKPALIPVYDSFRTFVIEVGGMVAGLGADIYNGLIGPLRGLGTELSRLTGLTPSVTAPQSRAGLPIKSMMGGVGAMYVSPAMASPMPLALHQEVVYDSTSGQVYSASSPGEIGTPTSATVVSSMQQSASAMAGNQVPWSNGEGGDNGSSSPSFVETQKDKGLYNAAGTKAYDFSSVTEGVKTGVFGILQPLVDLENLSAVNREKAIRDFKDLTERSIPTGASIFGNAIKDDSKQAGDNLISGAQESGNLVSNSGQTFENHVIKSMMPVTAAADALASSVNQSGTAFGNYTNEAATALKLGAQVSAKFTTDAGNAVKIGLTQSGQQIAVIGQVAQENFAKAGGQFVTDATTSSATINTSVQGAQASYANSIAQGGLTHINSMIQGGTAILSGTSQGATQLVNGGATGANNLVSGSAAVRSNLESGSESIRSAAGILYSQLSDLPQAMINAMYGRGGGGGGAGYEQGPMPSEEGGDWLSCSLMGTPPVNPLIYTPPGGQPVVLSNITPYNVPRATISAGSGSTVRATVSLGSGLSTSYTKLGKYDVGGISETPQLAILNTDKPEIHLTKENVREFLGVGGGASGAPGIHIYLDGREITNLIMKKAKVSLQGKGMNVK